MTNLSACLDQCSLSLLRQIADRHGLDVPEVIARSELMDAISRRLFEPGHLDEVLRGLDESERRALSMVASEGGEARGFLLQRTLHDRSIVTDDDASKRLLASLLRQGLMFRSFHAGGPDRGEVYVVPDEVLALIPVADGNQHPSSAPPSAQPPDVLLSADPLFSLFTLASFVRGWRASALRGQHRESQAVAFARETADVAVEVPGRSSRERWALLAHLGIRVGILSRGEDGIHPEESIAAWLGRGHTAEAELWQAYLDTDHWNDLERATAQWHRFAGHVRQASMVRQTLVAVLASVAGVGWILVDDLLQLIRHEAPDFLREGFDRVSARLVDLRSGEVLGGPDSWERIEAALFGYLISGPFYWLGLLDWGQQDDRWDRVRVSARGQSWLDRTGQPLLALPEHCSFVSPRGVMAGPRVDLGRLWEIEPYLHLVHRGPPSGYELTRLSFARGLEAGGDAAELKSHLYQSLGREVPQTMGHAIDRWASRSSRFRIGPAVLLSASDETELAELFQHAELAALITERLGPRTANIPPAKALELTDALERLGHLPEVDASLQLLAGRRAYASLVDEQVLETLLVTLYAIRAARLELFKEVPHGERLLQRLELALGPIAAPKLARKGRAIGRRLKQAPTRATPD